ncbi:hypothetical protein BDZ94DRAFT_835139 [Collybia nuda]|uniref:Uncharacterized protein n=1 Tax=Collybia nuda TaxID=64659 RepID=A0A9P6CJ32_9AGAR|nr:hypothetical protein BDZ94DRAFT_835139 [Collybia nuda]
MAYVCPWSQSEVATRTYVPLAPNHAPPKVLCANGNFPHQALVPISSYSSLAGALDAGAITTRTCSQSICKSKIDTNSLYPYPVSHNDPTQQAHAHRNSYIYQELQRTSSSRSPKKHHGKEQIICAPLTKVSREPGPSGPTNHVLVPQREFREPEAKRPYTDPYFRHPPITFQTANIPELGVRVGKVMERYSPGVIGDQDLVMAGVHEKEIRFWILWPGYSTEPIQKRMKTQNGTISRDTVLMVLANAVLEFTHMIQKKQIPVQRGYEDWTIGVCPDNTLGIVGSHLFITRLLHRGGSNWQPEIWAPKRV